MKKNFLALSAIVLAIAVSSFTTKRSVISYLVYKTGATQEKNLSNYNQQSSEPATDPGSTSMNWMKITEDNGSITTTEFNTQFEAYDQTSTSLNLLSDEAEIADALD